MARCGFIHCCVAVLVWCGVFDAVSATVAVGKAGEETVDGLTIKTSVRHLATVLLKGYCMNVDCSYTPTGYKPPVNYLALHMYNKDSASYNIIVDDVSEIRPQPLNTKSAFSATGAFSTDNPTLHVDVRGQDICQFARFQCVATFTDGTHVGVESNDDLPFAKESSSEEWLKIVKAFVTHQIELLSRKMNNKLSFLEIKVGEILTLFQKNTMQRAMTSLDSIKKQLTTASNRSGKRIRRNTQKVQESTFTGIQGMKDNVEAALKKLNFNVDEDITRLESSLWGELKAKNFDIIKRINELDKVVQDRIMGVQKDTGNQGSKLEKRMEEISTAINNNLNEMRNDFVKSIDTLEKDINLETGKANADHKKESEDLKANFKDKFESLNFAFSQQIENVNIQSKQLSDLLRDRIMKALLKVRNLQREKIGLNITTAVKTLETSLEKTVDKINNELISQVGSLENSVGDQSKSLSDQLNGLDLRIISIIENFQQSLEKEVNVLQTQVTSGLVTLMTIVNNNVENLGTKVVETTGNLENQLLKVKGNSTRRLNDLRTTTLNKIKLFDENVINILNVTRTNIVNSIVQLSTDLTDRAENADSGLSENIDQLNSDTQAKIGQIAHVMLTIVNEIAQQQITKIDELSLQFSSLLRGVSAKLNTSRDQTKEDLNTSSEDVLETVRSLNKTLSKSVEDTQVAVRLKTQTLQDNSTAAINSLRESMLKKIESILKTTTQEISSVLADFDKQAVAVGEKNKEIDSKLFILITEAIKIVQNDTKVLDNDFDVRAETFKSTAARLRKVNTSFTELGDTSKASFNTVAANVASTAGNHLDKIKEIHANLDALENTRHQGREKSDKQISEINTNLNITGAEILKGLGQSFGRVDRMMDRSATSLKQYLRPDVCEKGMGFLASSSLTYVVIHTSKEMNYEFLCDAHTDGGGWIVIQRRESGDTSFYRVFKDYEAGFGTVYHDFWLGLEKIHDLTSKNEYELRVDMTFQGMNRFAQYGRFSIGDAKSNYQMSLGEFSGTAGDSMRDTDGMKFTTQDRDNDRSRLSNCARSNSGAWWYNNCQYANLNGYWGRRDERGVRWQTFSGTQPLVRTEMKIRLKSSRGGGK